MKILKTITLLLLLATQAFAQNKVLLYVNEGEEGNLGIPNFAGPNTVGLITSTAADTNKFLKGNGTWDTTDKSWNVSTIRTSSNIVTFTYSDGPYISISLTNSPTILTFDLTTYPTNGSSTLTVDLFTGTNSVTFTNSTIDATTAAALTISTNAWNSLIFHKGFGMTNFLVR